MNAAEMKAKCEAIARDTTVKNVNTCIETATAIADTIAAIPVEPDTRDDLLRRIAQMDPDGMNRETCACVIDEAYRALGELVPSEPDQRDAQISARTESPDFVESLQGFASFCETASRGEGIQADECSMLVDKFRDGAFVVSQLQKLRDQRDAQIAALRESLKKIEKIDQMWVWREKLTAKSVIVQDNGMSYTVLVLKDCGLIARAALAATEPKGDAK